MKEKISLTIIFVFFLAVLCLFASCGSSSKTKATNDNEEWVYVQTGTANSPSFNPKQITQEQYAATKRDVQHFIEELTL